MKRRIIIITGTCAVGKSTVSREIADRINGAVIKGDEISEWIRPQNIRQSNGYQEELIVHICSSAIDEFISLGLDVVLDNVWTPAGINLFYSRFGKICDLSAFWLFCSKDENHRRDDLRQESSVMGSRIDELLTELDQMKWPSFVQKLDTTFQSSAETIESIMVKIIKCISSLLETHSFLFQIQGNRLPWFPPVIAVA